MAKELYQLFFVNLSLASCFFFYCHLFWKSSFPKKFWLDVEERTLDEAPLWKAMQACAKDHYRTHESRTILCTVVAGGELYQALLHTSKSVNM